MSLEKTQRNSSKKKEFKNKCLGDLKNKTKQKISKSKPTNTKLMEMMKIILIEFSKVIITLRKTQAEMKM